MNRIFINTDIGYLMAESDTEAITALEFRGENKDMSVTNATPLLEECRRQIEAYFCGSLKEFDLPLKMNGTDFQKKVWKALLDIPYGETMSYGQLAAVIGNPKASRAVGMANHNNPISIIVPCHRVIGANGKLVGYGGGLYIKEYLLNLEQKYKMQFYFH